MHFGKNPENMKDFIEKRIDKLLSLQNPDETCHFMPERIILEPIAYCNLNCIHCVRESVTRKRGRMDFEDFKKIIDKISPYNINISIGSNGEALLHRNITDMVRYIKEKDLYLYIVTNATVLKEPMAREFIKSGLDRIVFSFDSVDKEVYESIRIGAKFEPTLRNIFFFLKENYEAGMPVYTAVSWTTSKAAKESPTNIEEYFNSFPLDAVYPSELLNMFGDTQIDDEFTEEDIHKNLPKDKWPLCINSWENMGVRWNGGTVPCVVDFDGRYEIGNLLEQDLEEVWNGEKVRRFRRAILDRKYEDIEENGRLCTNCNAKWLPGFDLLNLTQSTKDFFYNEINCRERPVKLDNEKRYKNLLAEMKKRGWL